MFINNKPGKNKSCVIAQLSQTICYLASQEVRPGKNNPSLRLNASLARLIKVLGVNARLKLFPIYSFFIFLIGEY